MKNKKHLRILLFMMSLIALCIAFFMFFNDENKRCLGIEVVNKNKFEGYTYQYNDFRNEILYYGEKAPIDF